MTSYKIFFTGLLIILASCETRTRDQPESISLVDSSLSTIFEKLNEKTNPFEFYKEVYENFRFELKSTLILSKQSEDALPPESVTLFESSDTEESRFLKKSLDPISEVEWIEKQGKDFIRYDDSKHFLRTAYNPEYEKWKKRMFLDIQSVFDLKNLETQKMTTEKNQWSCYESDKQKICIDSKTGLPIFGRAIKQIKPETAVSMVFSLTYGQEILPSTTNEPEKNKDSVKKQPLQKKKRF